MNFTKARYGFEGALVGAIRDVFDPNKDMFWGSDYRKNIVEAVRPVIGDLTVAEAYSLAELCQARMASVHGREDSCAAAVAWEGAFDITIEAMSNKRAEGEREALARFDFFERRCIQEDGDSLLVYAYDVLRMMRFDWYGIDRRVASPPSPTPTFEVVKGGAA